MFFSFDIPMIFEWYVNDINVILCCFSSVILATEL